MRYRLIVTTDGRPGMVERALASLDERVRPRPAETVVVDDSGDEGYGRYLTALLTERSAERAGAPWGLAAHSERLGFCRTVADAWRLAGAVHGRTVEGPPEWVLWLEDDFVFVRALDLPDLALVLDREPQVAQMALYRQPVNAEEVAAGGYIAQHAPWYHRRGGGRMAWFETTRNWTTNPSLFRAELARRHPWPGQLEQCEGRFGFILRGARPGTTFGIWGAGDPWVTHDGERAGKGY